MTAYNKGDRVVLQNHVGLVDVIELDREDVNGYLWYLVWHSITDRYLIVREDALSNV